MLSTFALSFQLDEKIKYVLIIIFNCFFKNSACLFFFFFLKVKLFGAENIACIQTQLWQQNPPYKNKLQNYTILQPEGAHILNILLGSNCSFTLQVRFMTSLGTVLLGTEGTYLRNGNMYLSHNRVLTDFLLERMGRLRVTLNPLKTLLMGSSEASLR